MPDGRGTGLAVALLVAAGRAAFFLACVSAIGTLCGLGAVWTFFAFLVTALWGP